MKLKLHIPEEGKIIKIKDIAGGIAGKVPRLIFSVNIQDELILHNATQNGAIKFVMVDCKMREYIHGDIVTLREHYYEKGTGNPMASYYLVNLEYKNFGLVSLDFVKKLFKKVTNKYRPPQKYEPPPTNRPGWWPDYKTEFMRIYERAKAYKRWLKFFQDFCRFHLKHLNIIEEVSKNFEEKTLKIISVAPT